MSADTERTFTARMKGQGAAEMTLGGIDLLRPGVVKGVDLYLRAGQTPEVVIRPMLDCLEVDLESGDGKEPRYVVSPEVGVLLTALGWDSPEFAEGVREGYARVVGDRSRLESELATLEGQHHTALDRIKALEEDRDLMAKKWETEQATVASLQEVLTTAHGRIQDLELANTSLQGELDAVQATQDRLQHPYDTTGR